MAKDDKINDRRSESREKGSDRRSQNRQKFLILGYSLAASIALVSLLIFCISFYQLEFWSDYFYKGSANIGEKCQAAAVYTKEPIPNNIMRAKNLQKIKIPHVPSSFETITAGTPQPNIQIYYNCRVDTNDLELSGDITYLHTGWLLGEEVRIYINGTERASFSGADKPAIALSKGDIDHGRINLEVFVFTKTAKFVGFTTKNPVVLASNRTANTRLFALSYSLKKERTLYYLLPLMTLSIVMILGWLIGFKTRVIVVAMSYVLVIMMRYTIDLYGEYLPINHRQLADTANILYESAFIMFVVFSIEILRVFQTYVMRILTLVGVVTFGLVASIFIFGLGYDFTLMVSDINMFVSSFAIGLVLYASRKNAQEDDENVAQATTKTRMVVRYLLVAVLCANWFDQTMTYYFQNIPVLSNVRLMPQVERILPLMVGGILFYTIYLIEQLFQEEKQVRAKMEGDLTLAANLQGILVPSELTGISHGYNFEIESQPHGILGGDWVKHFSNDHKALFILGDVVGKGPSAALTHSGIAAAWETGIKLWSKDMRSSEELLTDLNTTMFDLFKGGMNTTFASAEVQKDGSVRVAAGGNYWLHLNPRKCVPITTRGGSLLGMKKDFAITFQDVSLEKGDWLICFTDGVIEGNRPIKRFLREVATNYDDLTPQKIREMLVKAGEGEVHPDDASTLLLRFDGESKEAAA